MKTFKQFNESNEESLPYLNIKDGKYKYDYSKMSVDDLNRQFDFHREKHIEMEDSDPELSKHHLNMMRQIHTKLINSQKKQRAKKRQDDIAQHKERITDIFQDMIDEDLTDFSIKTFSHTGEFGVIRDESIYRTILVGMTMEIMNSSDSAFIETEHFSGFTNFDGMYEKLGFLKKFDQIQKVLKDAGYDFTFTCEVDINEDETSKIHVKGFCALKK